MTDIPSLRRGFAILRRLAERGNPMSAAALAHELGLPRSTTYHLLAELRTAGAIEHHESSKKFALGPLVAELGDAYSRAHQQAEERAAGDEPADFGTDRSSRPS